MRVWSKMALAMAAGAWIIIPASPCLAQHAKPKAAPKAEKPADAPAAEGEGAESPGKGRSVELQLRIGGLGADGCDVEVKPGNAACRFKKQARHVTSKGEVVLLFRDVEFRGADHNCTFAIVIHEKGQETKTVYRGFRMTHPDSARDVKQTFTCYTSSPSKVAGLERDGRVVR